MTGFVVQGHKCWLFPEKKEVQMVLSRSEKVYKVI